MSRKRPIPLLPRFLNDSTFAVDIFTPCIPLLPEVISSTPCFAIDANDVFTPSYGFESVTPRYNAAITAINLVLLVVRLIFGLLQLLFCFVRAVRLFHPIVAAFWSVRSLRVDR